MKLSTALLFTLLGLLAACSSDISNQSLADEDPDNVNIHLMADGKVQFEGTLMSIDHFGNELEAYKLSEDAVVELKVDANATMGNVTDIQSMLREKEALRINYKMIN